MNNVVVEKPAKVKKPKKKKSLGRKIFEWVFIGIFGAFALFVIIGNIQGEIKKDQNYGQSIRFGMGSFIVLTDSMEPDIGKDSAIITYQTDVSEVYSNFLKGQTIDITFANVNMYFPFTPDTEEFKPENGGQAVVTNRIMTHRLVEMHEYDMPYGQGRYVFVTSGINHNGEASKIGQYQYFTENEYLGVVKVSNQFLGKVFNFIVSPVGLIILLLVPAAYLIVVSSIDIFKAMKESENEEKGIYPAEGKLSTVSEKDRERLKKELLEEMKNKRKEKENAKQD